MSHNSILETKVGNESLWKPGCGTSTRAQLSFSKKEMEIIKCRDGPQYK